MNEIKQLIWLVQLYLCEGGSFHLIHLFCEVVFFAEKSKIKKVPYVKKSKKCLLQTLSVYFLMASQKHKYTIISKIYA